MYKCFKYIGLISLMIFSFIITEQTTIVAHNLDEIMIEINNNYTKYNIEGMNASIFDNNIIPGICSKKVNINKSYIEMKKIGFYNNKYYIYDTNLPKINIRNNLDKYIISGNKSKKNIYIFFELNTNNISKIDNTYNNYNFIINYELYKNNKEIINSIMKNNSILISNIENIKEVSNEYYINKKTNIYCYNPKNIKECIKVKSNSIGNIKEYKNKYLYNIKNNISNGMFIKYELNTEYIKEKRLIEEYIKSKGYILSEIDNSLSEC